MTTAAPTQTDHRTTDDSWYGVRRAKSRLGSELNRWSGCPAGKAAELLERNGPKRCPVEEKVPGWRRFIEQYRSYMQIILLGRGDRVTGDQGVEHRGLLIVITLVNAVVSLRQEGKAESAMNALNAMVKATARVRRDGSEAEIPAEEVVVGDVVLLEAGDEVAADGRIIEASSLQIDEAALDGRERAGVKGVGGAGGRRSRSG